MWDLCSDNTSQGAWSTDAERREAWASHTSQMPLLREIQATVEYLLSPISLCVQWGSCQVAKADRQLALWPRLAPNLQPTHFLLRKAGIIRLVSSH